MREQSRNLVLTAYDQLIDKTADPAHALELIEAAIRIDPYNEHFYQHAMRIHADRGDRTAARRVLRRLERRLSSIDSERSQATKGFSTHRDWPEPEDGCHTRWQRGRVRHQLCAKRRQARNQNRRL